MLHADPESFYAACVSVRSRARAVYKYIQMLLDEHAELSHSEYTQDSITWAVSTVFDRSFTLNGCNMVLPVLDFLNHSSTGCTVTFRADGAATVEW